MKHSIVATVAATFMSLTLLTGQAYAGTCDSAKCTAKITRLYLDEIGDVYIQTDGTEASTNGCAGVQIKLRRIHNSFTEIYKTLLASYLADYTIVIRVDNSLCEVDYVYLDKSL